MVCSRRQFLMRSACGFPAVALSALWTANAAGRSVTHHPARARSVIFLYMDGGPSQVDTFDPKPRLDREHGQPPPMKVEPTQFNDNGLLLKSPWKFQPRGSCGTPVSDLLPCIGSRVDDIAVIRSMVSEFSEHTNANYFLHSGFGLQGRPSLGAWVTYGLGSEADNLPGFVVLNGGLIPPGGIDNFHSGYLPAVHQGSIFKPTAQPLANIARLEPTDAAQRAKLDLVRMLDQSFLDRQGGEDAIESAITNHELAFRMQMAAPDAVDLEGESPATRRLYGLDAEFEPTRIFAAQCLMARRLVERGVRFIELTCPAVNADRWDQHNNLKEGHEFNARATDQPTAALLTDLKSRGLLDSTLVVWAGEFGRTPFAQGSVGRDHNPFGFSIWLAGGGVRGGVIHGATDEFGYHAIENKVSIHDLHATILHLLGLDHTRLTYRFGGRDMRLTDVHGHVVHTILDA